MIIIYIYLSRICPYLTHVEEKGGESSLPRGPRGGGIDPIAGVHSVAVNRCKHSYPIQGSSSFYSFPFNGNVACLSGDSVGVGYQFAIARPVQGCRRLIIIDLIVVNRYSKGDRELHQQQQQNGDGERREKGHSECSSASSTVRILMKGVVTHPSLMLFVVGASAKRERVAEDQSLLSHTN